MIGRGEVGGGETVVKTENKTNYTRRAMFYMKCSFVVLVFKPGESGFCHRQHRTQPSLAGTF